MAYKFSDRKKALVFEVLLPKKMSYASKLAEVLDAFLSEDRIKTIPAIQQILNKHKDGSPAKQERFVKMVKMIKSIINGYSIYEVDGRFAGPNGPVDERTWVIRFIIHQPEIDKGISSDFLELTRAVLDDLVTRRFADELGMEDEVWMIEYEQCSLRRWIKE